MRWVSGKTQNGTIGLGHAGKMAQACINGDFDQGHKSFINPKDGSKNQSSDVAMGAFHSVPFERQQSLLVVSILDAPKTQAATEKALLEQQEEKQHQEELLQEKN
eukprot:11428685-Ditylum_brightwellii.AAC.1